MNIFIMVLVFLFMAGYYFMDSPAQRVVEQELQHAVNKADWRSIAECASSLQTATINGTEFNDPCVENYYISSKLVCLNKQLTTVDCFGEAAAKPEYSFAITSTGTIPETEYNNILEIIEDYYPNAGNFGIFLDDKILSSGGTKRGVPKGLISAAELSDGQLVYMTQYEVPNQITEFATPEERQVTCVAGMVKVYRFGRWQCITVNQQKACAGDTVWDSDMGECVPDLSRRPLCAAKQTAVMVDSVWQCVDPFLEKTCPNGSVAHLNYATLEWECLIDPNATGKQRKCAPSGAIKGSIGTTLRVPVNSCTDCEEMITDPETCASKCVPAPAKLNDPKCYPAGRECKGISRAFYFGFPSAGYVANVPAVSGIEVPFDISHSQNRMFNCLDCGVGRINTEKSSPPFVAVCE